MKDEALERIWQTRRKISERCDFNSRKLVKYLQDHKAKRERTPPPPDREEKVSH